MFTIVEQVGTASKAAKKAKVRIDGVIFKLHYTMTVAVLLAFSIYVTSQQFVGEPVNCFATSREGNFENSEVPVSLINTWCWIHGTYTIPRLYDKNATKWQQLTGIGSSKDPKEFRFHYYYQWVYFVLFVQAVAFYIPRWLWRIFEGGKVKDLSKDLQGGIPDKDEKRKEEDILVNYLLASWGRHEWYAKKYITCEILAFINVFGQMFSLNAFFHGYFMKYGLDVVRFARTPTEMREDPMIELFPRVTKCHYSYFGTNSEVNKYDTLCVMPLNVVNEKIFIFLWFWFIILSILSGISVCVCLLMCYFPFVRFLFMKKTFKTMSLQDVRAIVRKGKYGDIFLLYLIGSNIDIVIFRDLIQEVAVRVDNLP